MVKSFDSEKSYIYEGGRVFTTATLKTNYVNANNNFVSSSTDFNKLRTYNTSIGFDTFDRSWEPAVTISEDGVNIRGTIDCADIRGTIDWNHIPRIHYTQEKGIVSEKGDVILTKEEINKMFAEHLKPLVGGMVTYDKR